MRTFHFSIDLPYRSWVDHECVHCIMNQKISQPNLIDYLGPIANQALPEQAVDTLAVACHLSNNRVLQVYSPHQRPELDSELHDVVHFVDDPEDADVALIIHWPGQLADQTAIEVENEVLLGRRIVLVDLSQQDPETADPQLLLALTQTSVYVSNLAAYDVNLRRALTVALTPLRDGSAHRHYLVATMLYYWAWKSIVCGEVQRSFGATIPEAKMLRATTQAKSRMGAYLIKLRERGLRYFLQAVGYHENRVDGFWFSLEAEFKER